MDPQIQYCTTSDGVSIAYCVMGDGPPIIRASTIFYSHLLMGRRTYRAALEAQERRHMVVRYDGRGSGLSQRESPDFSLAARLLDLEAVVDRLRLERFALIGGLHGGLAAVAYAVRHPERVTHLILSDAYACGRDWYESPSGRAAQSMRGLTQDQWESYTLAAANLEFEFSDSERAKELATLMRASMEPDALLAFRDATMEIDVTDLLPQVHVPALVLCRPSLPNGQPKSSQALASRILDARLTILQPGEGLLRTIEEFLGDRAPADEANEAPRVAVARREETSAFRTILFTDIVGHTEMMQRLGDTKGRDVLREHERITREAIAQQGGAEIKTDGDSFMVSFGSVTAAVQCAVELQRALARHNEASLEPILVRMGLHAGEPVEERGDLFGSSVIMASRIQAEAAGGEILVSDVVRSLLSGKSFLFSDRGEFVPKGFDDAVRLYEVRWQEQI